MSQRPETENKTPWDKLPIGIQWCIENLYYSRRRITDILTEDQTPKNLSKGWVVDFSDIQVFKVVASPLYLLQPGEVIWPWGDNFRARQQMKAWEKELGGPVVHLLVPDTEQRDVPWLAQAVRRDWLTTATPESLLDMYRDAADDNPNRLRYRAVVIARTGQTPETLLKK
jgi:hypothetical protein